MSAARARVLVASLAAAAGVRPFVDYPHGAAQAAVAASPVSSGAGHAAPRESEYWRQRKEQQRREGQGQEQEQGREQEQEPPPQEQPRQPLPQNSSRRGVAGWSLDELNELFYSGAPSNSPSPNPSALARDLSPGALAVTRRSEQQPPKGRADDPQL